MEKLRSNFLKTSPRYQKLPFVALKIIEAVLMVLLIAFALVTQQLKRSNDDTSGLKEDREWKISPHHVFCGLEDVEHVPTPARDILKIFKSGPMWNVRACQQSEERNPNRQAYHEAEKEYACLCILKYLGIVAATVTAGSVFLVTIGLQVVLSGLSEGSVSTYVIGIVCAIVGLLFWGVMAVVWIYSATSGWPFVVYTNPFSPGEVWHRYYDVPTLYSGEMCLCVAYFVVCVIEAICFWRLYVCLSGKRNGPPKNASTVGSVNQSVGGKTQASTVRDGQSSDAGKTRASTARSVQRSNAKSKRPSTIRDVQQDVGGKTRSKTHGHGNSKSGHQSKARH